VGRYRQTTDDTLSQKPDLNGRPKIKQGISDFDFWVFTESWLFITKSAVRWLNI